ncbi:hypothetical protein, partial [Azotobacter armeniacus]
MISPLEKVSTMNRWTPSLSLAGSSQTTWPDGYITATDRSGQPALIANEPALIVADLHSIGAGSRFLQLNITALAVQKTKVYWTLASRLAETE